MQYFILIFISGVFLLFRNRSLYLELSILYYFFFPLIIYWLYPIGFQYHGHFHILLLFMMFLTYFLNTRNLISHKFLMYVLISIILLLLTLLISALINNNNYFDYILFFRNHFWVNIIFFAVLAERKVINFEKLFYYIVLLQVILAVFQYVSPLEINRLFSITDYEKGGELIRRVSDSIVESSGKLIVGSLTKITLLGNFLSFFIVYYIGIRELNNKKLEIKEWLFVGSVFIVILLTGVRASLATCVLGIMLIYLIKRNYKTLIFLVSSVLFYYLFFPILYELGSALIESGQAGNIENPFQRLLGLFGVLGSLDSVDESSALTLDRSLYMFQFIEFNTLLFGKGYYLDDSYFTGYGHGLASISDAQLLFIIAEFGIVVFFVLLLPFIFVLKLIKRNCNIRIYNLFVILFVVLIAQTIADEGIFWRLTTASFYALAGYWIKKSVEERRKEQQSLIQIENNQNNDTYLLP